ncbi:MAG: Gx transporter family protein [Oscillospiraceae bacterium]|nr:Gx transporter family protein [Oscillospiraceae bacterium]
MKFSVKKLALCAVLSALALGLSTLENLFPVSLAVPLPGVKLGLANIVTVFALYELGAPAALAILVTRCLLGGLFSGTVTALLFSLLGGLCAMGVMILLKRSRRLSIYGVSIGGAAAHNVGQIAAAVITLGNPMVVGYLPFLLAVALVTGSLTGFVVSLLTRATSHLHLTNQSDFR